MDKSSHAQKIMSSGGFIFALAFQCDLNLNGVLPVQTELDYDLKTVTLR